MLLPVLGSQLMSEQPLEGIEALMRMNGFSVGPSSGLRVVSGSFDIERHGSFRVHEFRIVRQCASDSSMDSDKRKMKVRL